MSGHWSPEWDDPEEEFPEGTDQADTAELASTGEARLSAVTAYLASVPVPVLPDAVEARISAALAAEAAARAEHAAPADSAPADSAPADSAPADGAPADGAPAGGARKLTPSGARTRGRRRRGGGGGPLRGFRVRPLMAAGSLGACLLFAGLGYAISRSSPQSAFSAAPAASASTVPLGSAAGASRPTSSAAAGASRPTSSAAASNAPGSAPSPGAGQRPPGTGSSFAVTASGTKYQRATLGEQVRAQVRVGGTSILGIAAPVPSPALRGCVLHLTDGVPPQLVDRATYEGEPAYVIATESRIWVVGLGCTAAGTEVVASVPLAS